MATAKSSGPLTEGELDTWSAVSTLLEWLPPALDAQLQRDSGMSHFEFGILFALSRSEGRTLRMSTLAGYANSTLSRLSRAAARLERHGWLRRKQDPEDGRVTIAALTKSGHDAVVAASPGHADLVRSLVFDSLSDKQTVQLREISRSVTSAIRSHEGWRP